MSIFSFSSSLVDLAPLSMNSYYKDTKSVFLYFIFPFYDFFEFDMDWQDFVAHFTKPIHPKFQPKILFFSTAAALCSLLLYKNL
jgi:hypothetical protein